jgi:hypothetical protein
MLKSTKALATSRCVGFKRRAFQLGCTRNCSAPSCMAKMWLADVAKKLRQCMGAPQGGPHHTLPRPFAHSAWVRYNIWLLKEHQGCSLCSCILEDCYGCSLDQGKTQMPPLPQHVFAPFITPVSPCPGCRSLLLAAWLRWCCPLGRPGPGCLWSPRRCSCSKSCSSHGSLFTVLLHTSRISHLLQIGGSFGSSLDDASHWAWTR